jgi:putative transposase
MIIQDDTIDQLLAGRDPTKDLLGPEGLIRELTKRIVERALQAELTDHLGYGKGEAPEAPTGNARNGSSRKRLKTESGTVQIEIPRDRQGTFDPKLVKKHQTRLKGFDERIISLYARGMTVREIQQHIAEVYGTEVSPDLISRVTDTVVEEVHAWQGRPLRPVWPVVWLDAMVVKVRHQGSVQNRSAYLAIGMGTDGHKEVLGLWLDGSEGAKFWLKVCSELKNRGVEDILIACCDGLKGFPDAIAAVFPRTTVQTCIVHMVRNSCRYVSFKDRRSLAAALKPVYTAASEDVAASALDAFEAEWGGRYPMIAAIWRRQWEQVIPFLVFPPEIRKVIYTTNAIESLNSTLRKILHARGHFPNDEAVEKLLYLALRNAEKNWAMPIKDWGRALHQFAIHFEGRLPV